MNQRRCWAKERGKGPPPVPEGSRLGPRGAPSARARLRAPPPCLGRPPAGAARCLRPAPPPPRACAAGREGASAWLARACRNPRSGCSWRVSALFFGEQGQRLLVREIVELREKAVHVLALPAFIQGARQDLAGQILQGPQLEQPMQRQGDPEGPADGGRRRGGRG